MMLDRLKSHASVMAFECTPQIIPTYKADPDPVTWLNLNVTVDDRGRIPFNVMHHHTHGRTSDRAKQYIDGYTEYAHLPNDDDVWSCAGTNAKAHNVILIGILNRNKYGTFTYKDNGAKKE